MSTLSRTPTPSEHALTDHRSSDASAWAPRCPQAHNFPAATTAQSEDCLYLTIWKPSSATQNSNLPVYVYLPGGSNIDGGASDTALDGAKMASQGLVVVHAQHRTGVLGFLPPSWLRIADPNFALRDVLLALRSVKDNIVGAGGNPSSVTLGGHSSGALVAQAMTGVPEAAGLFQRLILQSGPLNVGTQSAAQTTALQKVFYQDILGCRDARCAQSKTAAQLMTATAGQLVSRGPTIQGVPYASIVRPVFGTRTLPKDPSVILTQNPGQLPVKPQQVLVTTTLNEGGAAAFIMTPQPGGGPLFGRSLEARGRGKGKGKKEPELTEQQKLENLYYEMTKDMYWAQLDLCDEFRDLPDSELGPWEEKWYAIDDEMARIWAELNGWDPNDPAHQPPRYPIKQYCPGLPLGMGNYTRRGLEHAKPGKQRDISPADAYLAVLRQQVGSRADAVATQYPLPAGTQLGSTQLTAALERAFTDGGFRCPSRTLAGKYVSIASTYVGEFTQGGNHYLNTGLTYCDDKVCHADDVYAWWGNGPAGSDALSQDLQGRVASFVKNGNPSSGWSNYNSGAVFAIGGGQTATCPAGFWGGSVKYDFELYSQ